MKSYYYKLTLIGTFLFIIIFVFVILFLNFSLSTYNGITEKNISIINIERQIIHAAEIYENYTEKLSNQEEKVDQDFILNGYTELNDILTQTLEVNIDPEISRHISELKRIISVFKIITPEIIYNKNSIDYISNAELKNNKKQFLINTEEIKDHLYKLSTENNLRFHSLYSKIKIYLIFILIFGILLGLFLYISVLSAISESVSKSYIQSIIETMAHMLFVLDNSGRIIIMNKKAHVDFNIESVEKNKIHVENLFFTEGNNPLTINRILEKINRGRKEFECFIKSKSDNLIPVLISVNELNSDESKGFVLSAQDLSSLKFIQNQILHSEKMASLGTVAAGVAHEINTPIGFIRSNLNTMNNYLNSLIAAINEYKKLKSYILDNETEKIKFALESINKMEKEEEIDYILPDFNHALQDSIEGTHKIEDIVRGLKTFEKIDFGVGEFVDINKVLDNAISFLSSEIRGKCQIIKDYETLPLIRCIEQKIGQVFINILQNAIQALRDQGTIHIKTLALDETVEVTIKDSGVGIDQLYIHKIFEPFFTTRAVGSGQGLGLYIAYEIMKQHRGSIEVVNTSNQGTEFKIVFPITPQRNEE